MKTIIKDLGLWHKIKISQIHCETCDDSDTITVDKKDIPKLIKILQKLNYKGIPKKRNVFLNYTLSKEKKGIND